MAGSSNKVKMAFFKGLEAIGKGASNMATSAHQKLSEINLETRRREILSEFPMRAFDLWQKGVELPEPLGDMMAELSDLDERLSVLRAQRYAQVEVAKHVEAEQDDQEPAGEEDIVVLQSADDFCAESEETPLENEAGEQASPVAEAPDCAPPEETPACEECACDAPMDDGETGDNA